MAPPLRLDHVPYESLYVVHRSNNAQQQVRLFSRDGLRDDKHEARRGNQRLLFPTKPPRLQVVVGVQPCSEGQTKGENVLDWSSERYVNYSFYIHDGHTWI